MEGVGKWVWVWGGGCGRREVGVSGEVSVGVRRWVWVWGGGCGAGRWVWLWVGRCGCVEVDLGVGMENPTPVQKFTYLEPDAIISSFFVQSVISVIVCVVC